MRELRDLATAAPTTSSRRGAGWGDRQRIGFVLATLAVGCLAAAGYLAMQVPPPVQVASPEDIEAWVRDARPAEAFEMYEDLQKGLEAAPLADSAGQRLGHLLRWGASAALVGGVVLAVSAAALLRPRRN
jgi:hypothetical protein